MKGDFEVVECRTLKQEGKEDCRILSLDCSKEFLEYLATKTRNQRYPLFDHHVYINGGKRLDSKSNADAPELSPEVASLLIKTHNDYIMQQSAYRMGVGKAFDEAIRQYVLIQLPYSIYLTINDPLSFSPLSLP